MCGACGTGLAVPPWEIAAHGGTVRDLRARAREAEELWGGRLRIRPYGPAGYQVTGRTGRVTLHASLDGLVVELMRDHRAQIRSALATNRSDGPVAAVLRSRLG